MARDLGEIALKNTPEIMGIMKGLLSLPNSSRRYVLFKFDRFEGGGGGGESIHSLKLIT